ncbi:dihydroxyacetone kinase subunit DhaL [Quadrisphaera oryzae]|uniref:dihydroxyacetone kinase subunit DhaL n=1 Tax=Quadrisphaera TaxID=317661 RepID=UPI0016465672|nr:dihydroxyacetone kinase subunit DhaL [Quadrisphaera sp. RL12-1S]MBC3761028.1 dihydroxyacetone kinase subunit L [Quadrisphaera sp. RL12-1S]
MSTATATTTQADVERVVRTVAQTVVENEKAFSDLDAVAGDGDFGFSMARGFEKVLEGWDGLDRSDPGTFLTKVALVITSRIGGTSGPIWGTLFLRAGTTVKGSETVTAQQWVEALRAGVEGIKQRGGADLGDKTLLDALAPATDALEKALDDDADGPAAVRAFAEEARRAADATASMQARRGRASYSGERSIGSVDAGATAVAVLAEAVADELAR